MGRFIETIWRDFYFNVDWKLIDGIWIKFLEIYLNFI